jgi:PEP-CTERM motif
MKLRTFLATAFFAGTACTTHAALINWGAGAQNITGDANVDTSGTLLGALNFGDTNVSNAFINGVFFNAAAIANNTTASATFGNFSLTSSPVNFGASNILGSGATPFTSLSLNYQALLATAIGGLIGETITLTINSLTVGANYEFQWWASQSNGSTSSVTTADGGGGLVSLVSNTSAANGGVGQFATGTFTADSTSQVITFSGSVYPVLNALQLRTLAAPSVPEPGTALAGVALVGLCGMRRRR